MAQTRHVLSPVCGFMPLSSGVFTGGVWKALHFSVTLPTGLAGWWEEKGDEDWFGDTALGINKGFSSVQLLSHVWLSVTPWPCSMPGLPVHHQLLESTQTHVHWVGDAIQASHRLSSPSLPALNLSQHQGLFQWVSSLHEVAKVLVFQLQHQSFQGTPRTDLL